VEQARATVTDSAVEADEVAQDLAEVLADRPAGEIAGFEVELDRLLAESYRWDLWAAAYLINGGCSDDGFDYFRGWLVAQGRASWEAALADPDSLADLVADADLGDDGVECEALLDAAAEAYEQVTGDDEGLWDAVDTARNAADAARNAADTARNAAVDHPTADSTAAHHPTADSTAGHPTGDSTATEDPTGRHLAGDGPHPDDPQGEEFDFDDPAQMRARLPRLSAVFLDTDDA
jgi:uncharacterized protein DUF4240